MDELLRDFLIETTEHIEGAEVQLVQFERNPQDASLITNIFRLVHTIKGTSSFLGLERLERVGHAAESVMGLLRDGVPPTEHSVSIILAAIDRIKTIIEEINQHGSEPPGDDSAIISALEAYYEKANADPGEAEAAPEAAAAPDVPAEPAPAAEPVSAPPAEAAAAPAPAPAPAPEPQKAAAESPAAEKSGGKGAAAASPNQESIRVSVDTIERMMQLVSELVLNRNQLLELARHREDDTIKTPLQHLSTLTSDLQDAVMRARMQPVGRLYANLPRLVRELSTSLGKSIDLITEGADTELDRQLIEVIRDPLTHLIRNCADHGLEMPEERTAAGKPETGEVRITAAHEAGQITIDIADDGRGINPEKIKSKVIAQGMATEEDLSRMSNDEINRFIFEPGFSTAAVVSNVSGRGVGMDVVRSNIESIGGSVSLTSTLGKGSRFSLRIPLTLAIAPALIIEVAGQRFALPQTSVVEAVSLGKNYDELIQHVQNALVLKLREEVIPAVELRDVVSLEQDAEETGEKLAVVMRVGPDSFCIIVDGVADIQEIVVKPLSASISHLKVFSGHTILGDGSVVLILDPAGIAQHLGIEKSAEKNREQSARDMGELDRRRLVMFRAGEGAPKVLPLSLVSRIEMVETSKIESSDGRMMVLLQGRLMPLVPISPMLDFTKPSYPVLVVSTEQRAIGLVADEIVDILEETLDIQLASASSELIGSAEIRGETVELIDVSHFVRMAEPPSKNSKEPQRILLATDDQLLVDLLGPSISAAGYDLVRTAFPEDAGELFASVTIDGVVLDMDASGASDPAFMAAFQEKHAGTNIPVLGVAKDASVMATRSATDRGMAGLVSRFDRHSVLETLGYALDTAAEARASDSSGLAA